MYNKMNKSEWYGYNVAIDILKESIKIGDVFLLKGLKTKRTGDTGVMTPKKWRVIGIYPKFAVCEKVRDGYKTRECFLYQDMIGKRA